MRVALLAVALAVAASGQDAAFSTVWAADSPAAAARAADEIGKSNITFDEALRRLKAGRLVGGAITSEMFSEGMIKIS